MSTPTPARYTHSSRAVDSRVVRDLLAVLLLIAGACILVYAGFLVSDAAGFGVAGALVLATGIALGYDRSPR